MTSKRVVVTGLGAITPLGNSIEEVWKNLIDGVSGASEITRFDASKFKTKFACEVKNFQPTDYFDRKEARKLDLFSQFALVSADQAVEDADFDMEKLNKDRVGVIYGSGIGGIVTFMEEVRAYVEGDGTPRFNPFFIPKMISDIAAGNISIRHGFRGPNYAPVSACATSTNAIIDSLYQIRLGKADVMVTGGAEAPINEPSVGGFSSMQALSTRNDDFKTASRPFDADRDGFVIGEGAGTLILEELEHAKQRGAKIYAEIVGGGMSADAYHLTAPHPEGEGALLVMKNVLEDACMEPEEIDYINVHGTATPLGDTAETKAIKRIFGEHAYKLNISSTKSMTGHLLGAAGAVEAIAGIMAVINDVVPPTINNFNLDPEIDPKLNLTLNKAEKRMVNAVLSNTFGFGGHNMSVIFKKYTE
jgi:3-oxoacyl-[acyl-carrier-protein] synthase II